MFVVSDNNYNILPASRRRVLSISLVFRYYFTNASRLRDIFLIFLEAAGIKLIYYIVFNYYK